jgi:tetratricopeptide (TPR) repeat protein
MGLQDNAKALELLKTVTDGATEAGLTMEDPVLADGLNLLALAYSLTEPTPEETAVAAQDLDPENPEGPDQTAEGGSSGLGGPEANPPVALSPADFPQGYATWLALKKLKAPSPLTPLLLTALIKTLNGGLNPGSPPSPNAPADLLDIDGQVSLCLDLARVRLSENNPQAAADILFPLVNWAPPKQKPLILARMAQCLALANDYAQAETVLRMALSLFPNKPDPMELNQIASLAMALAEAILKQGRLVEEAEMELVGAANLLKSKLPPRVRDSNLSLARLYIQSAKILKDKPRAKDRANFQRQAERILTRAAKAHPERAPEIAALKAQLDNPDRKKEEVTPTSSAPQDKIPSPEVIRLEMTGYKLLNRPQDLIEPLKATLAKILDKEGPSPLYQKYLSLWLKYLEENEPPERLLAELDLLTANPPGADDQAKSQFSIWLIYYKARVLASLGQKPQAITLLEGLIADPKYGSFLGPKRITRLKDFIAELSQN